MKHITTIWETDHKCNSCFFQMVAGTSGTSVCPLLSFNPHLILVQPHPVSYQLFCRICLSLYLGKITAYRYLKPLANSHKFFLKCAAIFLSYGCISLYHIATLPLMVAVGTALLVCICQHPENIQKCGGVGVGVVFLNDFNKINIVWSLQKCWLMIYHINCQVHSSDIV